MQAHNQHRDYKPQASSDSNDKATDFVYQGGNFLRNVEFSVFIDPMIRQSPLEESSQVVVSKFRSCAELSENPRNGGEVNRTTFRPGSGPFGMFVDSAEQLFQHRK